MEEISWYVIDILLICFLLGLAWVALTTREIRQAVIYFIAFGLLLALVWFRLAAPDVALAEAAIGAGLSGALFLTSLSRRQGGPLHQNSQQNSLQKPSQQSSFIQAETLFNQIALYASFLALIVCLNIAFFYALLDANTPRLAPAVFDNLSQTGVSNPVTGVLLDFRAYDTMLELAVMLAAVLGIMALGRQKVYYQESGPMLLNLSQWLVPVLILFSGYMLWAGAHAPGGAFHAGAILAAAGVLVHLSGHSQSGLPGFLWLRGLVIGGIASFLLIGLVIMLNGQAFLDYPSEWAGTLILLIESFATLTIALLLLIAFQAGKPDRWEESSSAIGRNSEKMTHQCGEESC